MIFNGKEQTSSIRCQCPPGGKSNFQFTYDNAQPDKCNYKKHPDSKSNYNIVTLEEKENNQGSGNIQQRNCSKKMNYQTGKEQYNIFHNQFPEEGKQSSIKTNYNYGNEKVNIFHNQFPQEGAPSSIKTNYNHGNEGCNIFKNQFPQEGAQSSIRVTQNPGGNSHFSYGGEQQQ